MILGTYFEFSSTVAFVVCGSIGSFQAEKTEIQLGRPTAKGLLNHRCYCPKLLMWTTKTTVCLQTKATFHHLYGF